MDLVLLPLMLVAVFYFLLIRPQQKQRREMLTMQQKMAPGVRVMTGAGLIGTVVSIDEDNDHVVIEVAPGVTNTYVRRAIVRTLDEPALGEPVLGEPTASAAGSTETPAETIERLEREANGGSDRRDDRPGTNG